MISGSEKELGVKPRGWSSIGYHIQRNNEDGFLSLDFGLAELGPSEIRSAVTSELHGVNDKNIGERLSHYRKFLYEKGEISDTNRSSLPGKRSRRKTCCQGGSHHGSVEKVFTFVSCFA